MSNYSQTTIFTPKDSLPTNDPNKTIFGAQFDTEFGNISTAIATKPDNLTTASFLNIAVTGSGVPTNGIYLPSANTLGFATNSAQVMTLSSTGRLTVAGGITVSASGLSVTGGAATDTLSVSSTVSGAGITALFASPPAIGGTTPAAGSFTTLSATGNFTSKKITDNGNVIIAAPASGIALTVNGVASGNAIQITDGTITGQIATAGALQFGTSSNSQLSLYTNNITRATIANSGGVSIAAPTSGIALSVVATTANYGISVQGANAGGVEVLRVNQYKSISSVAGTYGINFAASGDTAATYGFSVDSTNSCFSLYRTDSTRLLVQFGQGGNLVIPTPVSGVAVTVNAAANNGVLVNTSSLSPAFNVAGPAATQMALLAGTQSGQTGVQLYQAASTNDFRIYIGRDVLVANSLGNVTIPAAASGIGFLVTANAGNAGIYAASGGTAHPLITQDYANTGTGATGVGTSFNVGYLEVPQNSQTVNYTAVRSDSGKHIFMNGTSLTFTVPANASVAFPIGTVLTVVNGNASNLSIAINTDTMTLAGTTTTGTRTLGQNGQATILKVSATSWIISGAGLS